MPLFLTVLTAAGSVLPGLAVAADDPFARARQRMVAEQLAGHGRGIANARVLAAMGKVPRHEFVPEDLRSKAYEGSSAPHRPRPDHLATLYRRLHDRQLDPQPADRVLEIGTGSGYQAAVLAELTAQVYTIEIIEDLASRAAADLKRLGYTNVHVRAGRRLQGLARGRALRRHHCHLRAGACAATAD